MKGGRGETMNNSTRPITFTKIPALLMIFHLQNIWQTDGHNLLELDPFMPMPLKHVL